jgi:hypothetical protein
MFPLGGKVIGWVMRDLRQSAVREYAQFPEFHIRAGQGFDWITHGRYEWIKAKVDTEHGIVLVEFRQCQTLLQ